MRIGKHGRKVSVFESNIITKILKSLGVTHYAAKSEKAMDIDLMNAFIVVTTILNLAIAVYPLYAKKNSVNFI